MSLSLREHKRMFVRRIACVLIAATAFLCYVGRNECVAAKSKQEVFASPAEAVNVMVNAVKTGDTAKLLAIFGPAGTELFSSGDDDMDRETWQEFVTAYEERNRLATVGKNKVVLHVGKDDWAWPIPVVKSGQTWHFDTNQGKQEILARRIGGNELSAIQVCLAYVDAQREYARAHRTGGLMEYAQKFTSDSGKKDGLCWEGGQDSKQSPMGPLVGKACKASYSGGQAGTPQPYHGYYYKILTKQGRHAPGGAYDYIVDGKMVGGFALVAYPARYASSGIMTFVVNQDSVVYQKNLGKNTEKMAEAMTTFDPDQTWKRVE